MPKISAGVLLYRLINGYPEILLFHPGGPYWAKKDAAVWSIPKGEVNEKETQIQAAERELEEESGIKVQGKLIALTPLKQKSNKIVWAWALEQNFNPSDIKSNLFEMEWPPSSGHIRQFPEMDKAAWFTIEEAKLKILSGQVPFLEELEQHIQLK
jgi:predicted NUDIX family NTP pyrophosphohydrolase